MAEPITSAVARAAEELSTCIRKLPSSSSTTSLSSTLSRIKRFSNIFVHIQSKLNEAEKMEIGDGLRELKEVALAAEDVLDEFLYEELRLRSEDGGHMQEAIVAMVHSFGGIVLQRTEEIESRFDDIAKRVDSQLKEIYSRDEKPVPRPTSSLVEETNVVGRENDVKQIKLLLLDLKASGYNEVSVIAIVGMGGLGKTTLAQLVYHNDTVRGHFDFRLWVSVSENFDLVRLTRAMIESCTQKAYLVSELDTLQVRLKEKLDGKRFLLVLDDVWEQDNLSSNLDKLTAPLHNGSKGSKIIITTRNVKVSKMARATSTYHLPRLEESDCLKLLFHQAFDDQDPDLYPNLKAIGRRISKKCGGLPLVAKTLGGLLYYEDDEQNWNGILHSDIWDIDKENVIMPVLKLSYQYLPVHLRRCFRYCSVFPKDYQFNKDELVRMWMAHGYIPAKGRKLMEDVGKECFDGLLYRSFFQTSQDPEIFLMHDLIHDLAKLVSAGECYILEGNEPCSIPQHVQHLSIDSGREVTSITSPEHTYESGTLRSFLFSSTKYRGINYTMVLDDLFSRIKHLRVLNLSDIGLKDLPNSIACLKHLRYLGLQRNFIRQLPESVGSLYHLQTLDLKSCLWEVQLPDSMSNLLNLRHLICDQNSVAYPVGIRKLTNLETMPGFHVSRECGHAKLGELKDINKVRSRLLISGIHNMTDAEEAKKACLEKKENIRSLDLKWEQDSSIIISSLIDDEVLESLRPNHNLESICIFHFLGRSVPSWLGHPSFSKLVTVTLTRCRNWTSLPPLGQLPSLRHLSIELNYEVRYIGREFFSGGFPRLEKLVFRFFKNWESWCGAQEGELPRLKEFHVVNCDHLKSLSVINLYSLQDVHIKGCPALQASACSLQLGQLPSLQNIYIWNVLGSKNFVCDIFCGGLQSLETLNLVTVHQWVTWSRGAEWKCVGPRELIVAGCTDLESLDLYNLNALEHLEVKECNLLQFSNEDQLPPTLKVLDICWCENLASLPLGNLNALEHLVVMECKSFQFSNENQLPSTLKVIKIHHCSKLASLPLGNLNVLQHLEIKNCDQLQFSNVDVLPPTLKILTIDQCRFLTKWCQYHRQRLAHIPQLNIKGIDKEVLLRNVFSVQEATDAGLGVRQRLWRLDLVWDCGADGKSFRDEPEKVLENLQPHGNLNKLVIQGYIGFRFAAWLGDPSFSNLVYVRLLGCSQCELLPPLGQLPHLMDLYIEGAHMLKLIGNEFLNDGCRNDGRWAFPSLRKLEFNDMPNWEQWVGMEKGYLPSLCELILKRCPMLNALPYLPPSLNELQVANCDQITLPHSFDHLTSLHTIEISQAPSIQNFPDLPLGLIKLTIRGLPALVDLVAPLSLRDLVLEGCRGAMVVTSLPRLTHLTSLRISDFQELPKLPLHNLLILRELDISNCPELISLECSRFSPTLLEYVDGLQALKSLERLSITNCPKLHFPASDRPPSALQSMDITDCPSIAPWYDKHRRKHIEDYS